MKPAPEHLKEPNRTRVVHRLKPIHMLNANDLRALIAVLNKEIEFQEELLVEEEINGRGWGDFPYVLRISRAVAMDVVQKLQHAINLLEAMETPARDHIWEDPFPILSDLEDPEEVGDTLRLLYTSYGIACGWGIGDCTDERDSLLVTDNGIEGEVSFAFGLRGYRRMKEGLLPYCDE